MLVSVFNMHSHAVNYVEKVNQLKVNHVALLILKASITISMLC